MIDAWVKPADIVAHDDEDIGFAPGRHWRLLRLLGLCNLGTVDDIDGAGSGDRCSCQQNVSAAECIAIRSSREFLGLSLVFGVAGHSLAPSHYED